MSAGVLLELPLWLDDRGGGTAVEDTQALYEWNGKSLASPIDISIDFH